VSRERKRGTAPFYAARKRFGQHFLEPAWVDKLIREISPRADDTFLEIGPGRGALTRPLAERVRRLVAFEIDHDLAATLSETAPPNQTIVDADFLEITIDRLHGLLTADEWGRPIRVAGNLPYNVASPILFKLAELRAAGAPLSDAHVMLQREVADRLVAAPGSKQYGVLTVLVGHTAEVAKVLSLPPGAFRPAPKVDSAVVRLRFHAPDPPVTSARIFADLVRAVFTRRRKTLSNALLAYPSPQLDLAGELQRLGIDGRRRPETLTIAEFTRVADMLADAHLPVRP
jgi:16S rRNA (adenine1518-N6/adenine1519-N6)-dimethyltransferase